MLVLLLGYQRKSFGQQEIIDILPIGPESEVIHDEQLHTIDILLTAETAEIPFWDFDNENLVVLEKIGATIDSLPVVFQGRIQDKSAFGEKEIYQLKTQSKTNYHKEERTYIVKWIAKDNKGRTLASDEATKNWLDIGGGFSLQETYSFADIFVLGALVLSLLLLLLSELIPVFRKMSFRRQYVTPYSQIQKAGERTLHPITGQELRPNEEVVVMCSNGTCRVPYDIWKKSGYKCIYYPDKCSGSANIGFRQFFQQAGYFKKLNWLWFGAVGGLLAWSIAYLLEDGGLFSKELATALPMGIGLGIGLTFMLTWVDEKGRDVSILRILLKTVVGVLAAGLLFFSSVAVGIANTAIGMAVTWIIFCVLLGAILSIQSSISWLRGIISGLIAGIASGLIYLLFANLIQEAELVRMITFVLLGGVLGLGIIQVVKQLDKIELELLAPSARSGLVFALDKWLNKGEKIIIGKDIKRSNVRVKWEDDYVQPSHAELSMKNNQVFIKPLGDAEIWVNDTPLNRERSKSIKGGDRIRLSRVGPTLFKYLQKSTV